MAFYFPIPRLGLDPVSGKYYGTTGNAANITVPTQARAYAMPIFISTPTAITALGFHINTNGVGSVAKAAILAADGAASRPNTVLRATSEVSTTAGDVDMPLSSDITLPAGVYWLASIHSWTTTAPACNSNSSIYMPAMLLGSPTANGACLSGATAYGTMVYADMTYATAFTTPFGTSTEFNGQGAPVMSYKTA